MTKRQLLAFARHFSVTPSNPDLLTFTPDTLTRMFRAYDDTRARTIDTKPQDAPVVEATLVEAPQS